eukprot:CAMPEP_0198647270 /NCGR_PEP_ID=MMETSP1467-20131203/2588_1 /TAXON_ID=1462469 /ORGANISM="unid. sp., Strain CCMP2135" /LENGTH=222 /DNA_ID=CAMNT_0044382889 /DNA_START=68 /DNA_END=737 /DNA_ORIENTATION=-
MWSHATTLMYWHRISAFSASVGAVRMRQSSPPRGVARASTMHETAHSEGLGRVDDRSGRRCRRRRCSTSVGNVRALWATSTIVVDDRSGAGVAGDAAALATATRLTSGSPARRTAVTTSPARVVANVTTVVSNATSVAVTRGGNSISNWRCTSSIVVVSESRIGHIKSCNIEKGNSSDNKQTTNDAHCKRLDLPDELQSPVVDPRLQLRNRRLELGRSVQVA